MRIQIVLAAFLLLLAAACQEDQPPAAAANPPAAANPAPGSSLPARAESGTPQPKLPTVKLWVGANELTAEIASTLHQIQTGMMWRTNMAEMDGMLFVFPGAQSVSFYMRNTLLPLSCAYLDPQGTVLEVYDMKPRDESPIPSKSDQVQYVLEMNQGWFERHGVRPGMVLRTQFGTVAETFQRRR